MSRARTGDRPETWAIRAGWGFLPGARVVPDVDVVVSGRRIVGVGSNAAAQLSAPVIVEAPGSTILPGLIDTHVHVTFSSNANVQADSGDSPDEEQVARGLLNAGQSLLRGVTTAVDCGGRTSVLLQLRSMLATDALAGSRLLVSGSPITSSEGHCHWLGGAIDGREQMFRAVRALVNEGVDFIKVMLTGGNITEGSDPRRLQFAPDDFLALAEECKRLDVPLVAHVHSEEALALAGACGARVAAHASCLDGDGEVALSPATVEQLLESGTFVDPTITVGARASFPGATEKAAARHELRAQMLPIFARMREQGIPLLAGTDAGVPGVFHGETPEAIEALHKEVGLSAEEAISCATSRAAEAFSIDGAVGSLREGLLADIILVEGDVRGGVSAIAQPSHVWREGVAVPRGDLS